MTTTRWNVRAGTYYDSVVLMQLQRGLLGLPGVLDAGVVMATLANRELLASNQLLVDAVSARPDDLLIVVKADSEKAADAAIGRVDELLLRRRSTDASQEFRPHSLAAAAGLLPEAQWVLVSVPGRYAAAVARDALGLGRHVFLYSDNVSLEDEIALKQHAREKGLLVMGPDCGTAIVNGVGLGFANRVRRGPIGLIGASGTGLQAVTSRIHSLGSGVSHAFGTGGRDLRREVGGITAHQALDLLKRDPDTRAIVLISKPPSPEVATGLISEAQVAGKPVTVYFIGYPASARRLGNVHFAVSTSDAAETAIRLVSERMPETQYSGDAAKGYVRGLFSGGTLAYEALLGLQTTLSPIHSNAPIVEGQRLADPLHSQGHTIIDLGDEFFMVGRLHPMIDNDLRIRRMRQEAADLEVGTILLDVVLGESAHPNPAGELAPVIGQIGRAGLEFIAIVVGTDEDPQDTASQVSQLSDAGVRVFRTVGDAVEYISQRCSQARHADQTPVDLQAIRNPVAAINVGLESFYDSLIGQGARAVHVDWRPPAAGNEKLGALLSRMKKP